MRNYSKYKVLVELAFFALILIYLIILFIFPTTTIFEKTDSTNLWSKKNSKFYDVFDNESDRNYNQFNISDSDLVSKIREFKTDEIIIIPHYIPMREDKTELTLRKCASTTCMRKVLYYWMKYWRMVRKLGLFFFLIIFEV